ncbi:hypothetical protein [Streptomyces sp. NPDC090036]|uniref:hypothetical protein n=1 Tax=Streptomyces sp. NPDC090036 TaxID=3365926 RepID=UPI00382C3DA1
MRVRPRDDLEHLAVAPYVLGAGTEESAYQVALVVALDLAAAELATYSPAPPLPSMNGGRSGRLNGTPRELTLLG